jgi:hypothetical protein
VQSNKEQTTLAQQIMETSQLVTQMAAWQGSGGGNSEAGAVGGCGAGQPPGSPPAHRALHHPTPGRFRQEEEVPFHRAALPKLSFPNSMTITLGFGLISVVIISRFSTYQSVCGPQWLHCTWRTMKPSGCRCTN